ncbi:CCA tRNA nucleotidyltransferase [Halalkalibacter kiskunsagensis]|uniref:CCA tRNA nucleotidyltransferase n=1 Tax=Halalkalibacter kiskunsagensis TaxID=1548599 RepID=A0ABV6KBF3_9BACI
MSNSWQEAKEVLHTLKKNGFESYIVGGAVRDLLLNREIADVDIVTSATPDEVATIFLKTFMMNNQHETIIVRLNQLHFEVTTIRGETLTEDLKRRDLTINSLALDDEGEIIDLVNGEKDIYAKVLRSIDPQERMSEDPLRMLRVARFVSELGFEVDVELRDTLVRKKHFLKKVAIERITKEWIKLLKGDHRNSAINLLVETGMYEELPDLLLNKDLLEQFTNVGALKNESETICWAIHCLCIGANDETPLKQLLLSKERLRGVSSRLSYYKNRKKNEWTSLELYQASIQVALDVEKIRSLLKEKIIPFQELNLMWEALPIHNRSELAVSGRDVLRFFKKEQGPWLKEVLSLAEHLVVTRHCRNDKHAILQALEKRSDEL